MWFPKVLHVWLGSWIPPGYYATSWCSKDAVLKRDRERHMKTDISNTESNLPWWREMNATRCSPAAHRLRLTGGPGCRAQRLGDNLFSQPSVPSRLGQSPGLWATGEVECSWGIWAVTRGSGDTFRNCPLVRELMPLHPFSWEAPSAADCFPCCLATISNHAPGLNPASWHPWLLILVRSFFFYLPFWMGRRFHMAERIPDWWQKYESAWLRELASGSCLSFLSLGGRDDGLVLSGLHFWVCLWMLRKCAGISVLHTFLFSFFVWHALGLEEKWGERYLF